MNAEEIKSLVQEKLQGCEVFVAGEGSNYQVVVVGDVFVDLNAVKRQQLIYACLNEQIASGAIHALTIKTYLPAEWNPEQQD